MNYDEYGEVINGELTYKGIAEELAGNAVIVGWSDGNGMHFDILFTLHASRYGNQIQGGIKPPSDLFVSIMGWGAFAFEIDEADTHPGYYEEKLGNLASFGEATSGALAELINGVRKLVAQAKMDTSYNTQCTSACGNDYDCPHNDDSETEAI